MQLFNDYLVVYEREDGLPKVIVYHLPDSGEPLKRLQDGQAVDFLDPVYSVDPSDSEFSSSILRFSYSSLKTPPSIYDYDMKEGNSVLKKIDPVSHIDKLFELSYYYLIGISMISFGLICLVWSF